MARCRKAVWNICHAGSSGEAVGSVGVGSWGSGCVCGWARRSEGRDLGGVPPSTPICRAATLLQGLFKEASAVKMEQASREENRGCLSGERRPCKRAELVKERDHWAKATSTGSTDTMFSRFRDKEQCLLLGARLAMFVPKNSFSQG